MKTDRQKDKEILDILSSKPELYSHYKTVLCKDPFFREEEVSRILGTKNLSFGLAWDAEGPYKGYDHLEYKTSQPPKGKFNGTLKFHDYPADKTKRWIDEKVLLVYALFVNGEIDALIEIAPEIDGKLQNWVKVLQRKVEEGEKSPTISRKDWEDSVVCIRGYAGEFKNPEKYNGPMRKLIVNNFLKNVNNFSKKSA